MTLNEEYSLYERAMRDAKTDEERAELEGVRRSIIRRFVGRKPPTLLSAPVLYCPFLLGCALWVVLTIIFGGDLLNVLIWSMFIIGLEAVGNIIGVVMTYHARRPRGKHFR